MLESLNTVLKQCNVISMGLSKQKSSPLVAKIFNKEVTIIEILCRNSVMLFQWDCRNRNPVLLLQKKKSDIFNKEVTIIEILCQNSVMLFQWDCQNRNPVLLLQKVTYSTRK